MNPEFAHTKPATAHHRRLRRLQRMSTAIAVASLAGLGAFVAHAGNILWSNNGGSAWLTGTNWTGNATPGTTDVAQFGVNPTSATGLGINMSGSTNNGTANQAVGAIEVTSARGGANVTIGDSSTTTAGTLTLNGATVNSVSNVILRNNSSATLTLQPGQSGTAGAQSMSVALANATANVVNVDSTGNIVVSSNITGSGKNLTVNAASTGDVRLSGTSSYDGGTTITGGSGGGRLRIDAVAALPTTGTVAVGTGGRLTLNVAGTYGGASQALTFNPNQTANPSLDILSGAAVIWQGSVAINADTRIEASGSGGSLTFSGNATGSGALVKQAAGNLILSGTANTLTGATQIGNGTLTVSSGSSMGTGALTLSQTGTNNTALTLNNAAQSVGSLSGQFTATSGTQTQTITLNGTALTVNQSANGTYGTGAVSTLTSTITGTGSVTKSGNAKLTLTSANTYTGTTTIGAGTLEAAATGALGSTSGITVNSGGTLLLSGGASSVNASAPMNLNGGTISTVGNSISLGALILAAGSTFDFGTTGSSTLTFASKTSFTSGSIETFEHWTSGSDHLVFTADPGLGTADLANISFFDDSHALIGTGARQISFGGGGFEIVPVPEPATVLGAMGLLGFLGYRERRRVCDVWSRCIVPGFSFLGFLIFTGLAEVAHAFGPRGRRL